MADAPEPDDRDAARAVLSDDAATDEHDAAADGDGAAADRPGPDDDRGSSGGRRIDRLAAAAGRVDRNPRLIRAARAARRMLPGDSGFGDPLSVAGSDQAQLVGRRLADLTDDRPGLTREAGLSALQVWQSLSESRGRGRGDEQLAILFTDLVDFSSWALKAGDTQALELLRDVGRAVEPPVKEHEGKVVKRLGDGMMAVFGHPQQAIEAVLDARERLSAVSADGYRPRVRAGLHVGRPRKLGGDYLGVDVNVAARVADEAGADELLVSDRVATMLDTSALKLRKKLLFRPKGVPKDVTIYSVQRRR